MIELEKERNKITTKYRWETIDTIPLLPLFGANYCQPLIHMSKRLVYLYETWKKINQFAGGYMINTSIRVNKVFREQVEKCLRAKFNENKMDNIRYVMRNKDTCVIALTVFYESK